jgi:CBS domain-containing protein
MPTGSPPPEGGAAPAEPVAIQAAAEAVTSPTAADPPAPAEAVTSPAAADPPAPAESPEDEGRESIEVEAFESKPRPAALGTHRPPPPPSIRASGGRWHFDVQGKPKLAQDLMTRKIFTIGPNDKLLHLEEHMEKFRFGHLPVVDDEKLVGLITHGDLLHASASFLTQKAKEIDEIVHNFPASRIMKRDVATVRPTDLLADVAKLMWEKKVGCVLVTDDKERLVGIITEGDFIRLAHHFLVEDQK